MNREIQILIDGLTYNDSVKESSINYTLILLTLIPHLVRPENKVRGNTDYWYWALITSVLVQILLWFSLDVVGVSIIWCSMAGFNLLILLKEFYNRSRNKILLIVSVLAGLVGIIYYAVIFSAITTVAHIIGGLMGIGLFYLCRRLSKD